MLTSQREFLMKIIFLDIDGVLNSHKTFDNPKRSQQDYVWKETDDIDPDNISQLNRILKETNSFIVISSSWKNGRSVELLKTIAQKVKIDSTKIIDKTPTLTSDRGDEIKLWLKKNKQVKKFVILDDDNDMGSLKKHLIQTDPSVGLTEQIADIAIKKLLN
jgi:hypothetical protein